MIGVVLAGGRSSRMGEDKALVEVAGRPMIDLVVAALRPITDEIAVAGRSEAPDGTTALPDRGEAHRGPLAGLLAASATHPDARLVVVAVDQPWVRTETLRALADRIEDLPVVPVEDGIRQTTCAVFPPGLGGVGDELDAGGSIQSLLDRTAFRPVVEDDWQAWGEDGRSWFSADTMADISTGLERFGAP